MISVILYPRLELSCGVYHSSVFMDVILFNVKGCLRIVSGFSFRFVLLACDGLFTVFSPEEAVQFVLNVLEVLM